MSLSRLFGRKPAASLQAGDAAYISPVHSALVHEGAATALWAVGLMLAVVVTGVVWAAMTKVDVVTKATARVVPDGREQVIASLEGGILRELLVIEGQLVVEGQALAMLDPTRAEAQQAEGQARRLALRGAAARLHAEATGIALRPLRWMMRVIARRSRVEPEQRDRVAAADHVLRRLRHARKVAQQLHVLHLHAATRIVMRIVGREQEL
jgi:adhesin transport system membrane fusion protein